MDNQIGTINKIDDTVWDWGKYEKLISNINYLWGKLLQKCCSGGNGDAKDFDWGIKCTKGLWFLIWDYIAYNKKESNRVFSIRKFCTESSLILIISKVWELSVENALSTGKYWSSGIRTEELK